jgi:hypothetical protein
MKIKDSDAINTESATVNVLNYFIISHMFFIIINNSYNRNYYKSHYFTKLTY